MSGKTSVWTDEQNDLLRKLYPAAAWEEIEKAFPDHKRGALVAQAVRLSLRRSGKTRRPVSVWTDEKNDLLRKLYPAAAWEEIEKAFPGRSRGALGRQAIDLGLKRPKKNLVKANVVDVNVDSNLTSDEQRLLKALVVGVHRVSKLADKLETSSRHVFDLARSLRHKGYAIQINEASEQIMLARQSDEVLPGFVSIEDAAREFSFLVISEPRFGAKQAQISTLHWIYENEVDKGNDKFVAVVGGLVAGRPTPSIQSDLHKLDSASQTDWVVKHFPRSKTGCKTYVVSGRREFSWKAHRGFEIGRAICEQRPDMVYAGETERTFDVRGVKIKVIAPWDDNSPKGKSYGIQNNAENLTDDPFPQIIIYGGTHVSSYLPAYVNGAGLVTVSSLHKQMLRQKKQNRKIAPRIGCVRIRLFFDKDWKLESYQVELINLNVPGLICDDDYLKGFEDADLTKLEKCIPDKEECKQALTILKALFKQHALTRGEMRRLIGKPQKIVDERLKQLEQCGFEFEFPDDASATKSVILVRQEKEAFHAPKVKPEEIFQWMTKEFHYGDPHYNSKQDLPELVDRAHREAAEAGARRGYVTGDLEDGAGATGYRGHNNDVREQRMDDIEDYMVAKRPPAQKIKVASGQPPLLVTAPYQDEQGRLRYKEEYVADGTATLQTDEIDGNHAWSEQAIGHLPGRALAWRIPERFRYLGYMFGEAVVDGVYHKLLHNAGGIGYTMSYRLEGHMKAMRNRQEGGNLPKVLSVGNNHCAYGLLDGDLFAHWDPCFKYEDVFHVTRGLVPWIGFWLFEGYAHPNGHWTRVILEYRNYFPAARELVKSR